MKYFDILTINTKPSKVPPADPFGRDYLHQIGRSINPMPTGTKGSTMVATFVGELCWGRRYFQYYSYHRNPTGREFFVPTGTHSSEAVNPGWDG